MTACLPSPFLAFSLVNNLRLLIIVCIIHGKYSLYIQKTNAEEGKRTAVKGKPLTHATSPALPDVWVGECIGRSTASCRTQLLGRSVLWTESPQETPGICSPFTDALPPVLTPVDGCCSSGSLTRSPHRGRTASSIECPFRTRAAKAESTRQRSCRPLPHHEDTRRATVQRDAR